MNNVILFDTEKNHTELLPLSFTRPVSLLRVGILTIQEKWERYFPANYSHYTESYLSIKYPSVVKEDNYFIASHILPTADLASQIEALEVGDALMCGEEWMAYRGTLDNFEQRKATRRLSLAQSPDMIVFLYDLFLKNGAELEKDFRLITTGRPSVSLSPTNLVVGEQFFSDGLSKIFIEEGASVECATLNVKDGPIYIGKEVEVMEGSHIRAPFAACEHAVVNMGTLIYGATTLGPYCKVGGELNNVVMQGYANKAHHGFIGNAVIGEWCNLGAGTTASNLKNDYSEIKLWNYPACRFLRTGLQFCGLIMGDHSKAGVNCMFNTATVVGVGVNIYGAGFPRNFVASFSEGGNSGFNDVQLNKFFSVAQKMMARRGKDLTEVDKAIFESIYSQAENFK